MAFFRPSDPFVTNTPCFLGSKFEYYLTKFRLAKFAIRVYQARTFAMPNGNNRSDKYAPERGNEPPAQGNALGNKGNITDGALTGQKRYRWEENAFAPSGAESSYSIQHPGRCPGLYDSWPFRPPQHGRGLIVWFHEMNDARGSR